MSAIAEASELARVLAEPRPAGDQVKAAIRRAAHAASLSVPRMKSIWYREARRIDAEELDAIRAAVASRKRALARLVEVRDVLAVDEAGLDRESAARFVEYLRRMGALDCPGDNAG